MATLGYQGKVRYGAAGKYVWRAVTAICASEADAADHLARYCQQHQVSGPRQIGRAWDRGPNASRRAIRQQAADEGRDGEGDDGDWWP